VQCRRGCSSRALGILSSVVIIRTDLAAMNLVSLADCSDLRRPRSGVRIFGAFIGVLCRFSMERCKIETPGRRKFNRPKLGMRHAIGRWSKYARKRHGSHIGRIFNGQYGDPKTNIFDTRRSDGKSQRFLRFKLCHKSSQIL
jgi:hypothetical protein